MATEEELARVKVAEVVAAQRVQLESALAEAIEHRRRDEEASLRRARLKAVSACMRSDDGTGHSGHADGQY
jgi:hypothetical protein